MKRELIPGMWGRCGRAIPDPQASELDATVSYHFEDLHQGRDAQNRVPHFSPMSGKPDQEDVDNEARAIFWRSYTATLALVALCVLILANWPN